MPLKYELNMTIDQPEKTIVLSGELNDEDVERLAEFVQYAQEVLNTRYIQEGNGGKATVQWDAETNQLTHTVELPDWEVVKSFLHTFRPILLPSEPTNFHKVYNFLAKELDDPYFRAMLKQEQELFKGKNVKNRATVKVDDVIVNSENVLYDWLNSHEYHRDKEKKKVIDKINQVMPKEFSNYLFLEFLTDKAIATANLANFILVLLNKEKGYESPLPQP